jgi:zinc protease
MTNRIRATLPLVLTGTLIGCATAGQPAQVAAPVATQLPAAPDRTVRPDPGEAPDLELPRIQQFRLSNGVPVLLLEKHDIPLVQTNLMLRVGSIDDPNGFEGVASLTADMLREGAAGLISLELADELEMLGARYFATAGSHSTTLGLRVPLARWADGLSLMGDMLMRPDFPAEELERLRVARLTSLIRLHDQPAPIASALFDRVVFGEEHPYGRFGLVESALREIGLEDLRRFHDRHFRPAYATLVVVGAVDRAMAERELEAVFGRWAAGDPPGRPGHQPRAPALTGRTIYLVDMPGAVQSVVRMGRVAAARATEDFYALQVLNTILGGSFTSRLNQNLREEKGYTYGATSAFDFRLFEGPFFAGAAVQTEVTGPALTEFIRELRSIREPISEEEITLARNFLASRFPANFMSVAEIAGSLGQNVMHDLPLDYQDHYVDRILAVTAGDVARVARQYIDPDNIAIVIVGDRSVVEEQIRQLDLGPIQMLEVADVLGAPPVLAGGT